MLIGNIQVKTALRLRRRVSLWVSHTQFSSVQFSQSVVSDSLWPHESQHARPPCPSPTPRVYSNSCPSSQWYHPGISSTVIPFSSCPQSLPGSGSFPESTLDMRWPKYWSFSFSISPSNEHSWLISIRMDLFHLLAVQGTLKSLLQTTVQNYQFFGAQLSSQPNSRIHTWPLEKWGTYRGINTILKRILNFYFSHGAKELFLKLELDSSRSISISIV